MPKRQQLCHLKKKSFKLIFWKNFTLNLNSRFLKIVSRLHILHLSACIKIIIQNYHIGSPDSPDIQQTHFANLLFASKAGCWNQSGRSKIFMCVSCLFVCCFCLCCCQSLPQVAHETRHSKTKETVTVWNPCKFSCICVVTVIFFNIHINIHLQNRWKYLLVCIIFFPTRMAPPFVFFSLICQKKTTKQSMILLMVLRRFPSAGWLCCFSCYYVSAHTPITPSE